MDYRGNSSSRWRSGNKVISHIKLIELPLTYDMEAKRKQALKIIITLAIVWFAAALPVPFLWSNPDPQHPEQYKVYLEIAAIVSVPFIAMGVVWTLKPELATRGSR